MSCVSRACVSRGARANCLPRSISCVQRWQVEAPGRKVFAARFAASNSSITGRTARIFVIVNRRTFLLLAKNFVMMGFMGLWPDYGLVAEAQNIEPDDEGEWGALMQTHQ